jgi:hypothetical protein
VTTTYRAPGASINAWTDQDKEVQILGDDGVTPDFNDQLTDKGWILYAEGPKKDGVVVFFDGFQYMPWDWWWEGVKLSLGGGEPARERREKEKQVSSLMVRQPTTNGQSQLEVRRADPPPIDAGAHGTSMPVSMLSEYSDGMSSS